MNKNLNLVSDWVIGEIDSLNKEYCELMTYRHGTHPSPEAISNLYRVEKSNKCRAKIEAYIKLLDFMKELKDV